MHVCPDAVLEKKKKMYKLFNINSFCCVDRQDDEPSNDAGISVPTTERTKEF
jgi:hypothetical protein